MAHVAKILFFYGVATHMQSKEFKQLSAINQMIEYFETKKR